MPANAVYVTLVFTCLLALIQIGVRIVDYLLLGWMWNRQLINTTVRDCIQYRSDHLRNGSLHLIPHLHRLRARQTIPRRRIPSIEVQLGRMGLLCQHLRHLLPLPGIRLLVLPARSSPGGARHELGYLNLRCSGSIRSWILFRQGQTRVRGTCPLRTLANAA